jgi:ABC-type nitrate/sulfonate/bicarbonate transport system substrate-binding protein
VPSRPVILLLSVLLLALAVSGGEGAKAARVGHSSAKAPVSIRIGFTTPGNDVLYVMQTYPKLAPNNGKTYRVQWVQFQSTGQVVQAMATGALDAGVVGSLSVANGIEQGADILITGAYIYEVPGYAVTRWVARNDSGITKVSDMAGKTVGVPTGSVPYWETVAYLTKNGVTNEKLVSTPFGTTADAIKAGQIDVGALVQPFYSQLMATGCCHTVFSTTDVISPLVSTLQGFNRSFATKYHTAVKVFMKDWGRVWDWTLNPAHRKQVLQATSNVTKLPLSSLGYDLTKDDYKRPTHGCFSPKLLQNVWNFFKQYGATKAALQASGYVDNTLLPPACRPAGKR